MLLPVFWYHSPICCIEFHKHRIHQITSVLFAKGVLTQNNIKTDTEPPRLVGSLFSPPLPMVLILPHFQCFLCCLYFLLSVRIKRSTNTLSEAAHLTGRHSRMLQDNLCFDICISDLAWQKDECQVLLIASG